MYQLNMRQYEEREDELVKENEGLRRTLFDLHQTMQSIVEDTLQQDNLISAEAEASHVT